MAEKIDLRPRILEAIQKNGPVIPREIVKEVGGDTFIVGAVLMQLKDSGKIMVSSTKIGGTPAYYCEGQEEKLQELERYLDEKGRYSYNLLKDKKVLRDYDQQTYVRLSLRQIKDFSIPLLVMVHDEEEIFWKWYLTPLEEAENIIKEIIPTIPRREEMFEEKEEQKEEPSKEINDDKVIENKENAEANVGLESKKDEENAEDKHEANMEIDDEKPLTSHTIEEAKEAGEDGTKLIVEDDLDKKDRMKKKDKPKSKDASKKEKREEKKSDAKLKKQKHVKKTKETKEKNKRQEKKDKETPKKGFFRKIMDFFR